MDWYFHMTAGDATVFAISCIVMALSIALFSAGRSGR